MKYVSKFFAFAVGLFKSERLAKDLVMAQDFVLAAAPYIYLAGQIVAGMTPTTLDDQALTLIHTKYPRLFDGSLHTETEKKLYALGIAGELMEYAFPKLDTSIARTSISVAFLGQRSEKSA